MRKSRIALLIIVLVLLTASACARRAASSNVLRVPSASERCLEDEPCWDCNTMGNGLCSRTDTTPFEVGE
jgi:hypothetical protein